MLKGSGIKGNQRKELWNEAVNTSTHSDNTLLPRQKIPLHFNIFLGR